MRRRHRRLVLQATLLLGGLSAAASAQSPTDIEPDSVVLERTYCYGTCAVFRVSMSASGAVRYEPRGPIDTGPVRLAHVSPDSLRLIGDLARAIDLQSFPDTIERSKALCPSRVTDFSTSIVTLFRGGIEKQVIDYEGCFASANLRDGFVTSPTLKKLRMFEARIEAMARKVTDIPRPVPSPSRGDSLEDRVATSHESA